MKKELSISVAPSHLCVTIEDTKSLTGRLSPLTYHALILGLAAVYFGVFQCSITKWFAIGVCMILWIGMGVRKEIVIVSENGCQLKATRVNGLVARNKYIPLDEVSDIIINEGIVCYSSELYPAFVQSEGSDKATKRYHVLFDYTKLDRTSNMKIYTTIKDFLKEHK